MPEVGFATQISDILSVCQNSVESDVIQVLFAYGIDDQSLMVPASKVVSTLVRGALTDICDHFADEIKHLNIDEIFGEGKWNMKNIANSLSNLLILAAVCFRQSLIQKIASNKEDASAFAKTSHYLLAELKRRDISVSSVTSAYAKTSQFSSMSSCISRVVSDTNDLINVVLDTYSDIESFHLLKPLDDPTEFIRSAQKGEWKALAIKPMKIAEKYNIACTPVAGLMISTVIPELKEQFDLIASRILNKKPLENWIHNIKSGSESDRIATYNYINLITPMEKHVNVTCRDEQWFQTIFDQVEKDCFQTGNQKVRDCVRTLRRYNAAKDE